MALSSQLYIFLQINTTWEYYISVLSLQMLSSFLGTTPSLPCIMFSLCVISKVPILVKLHASQCKLSEELRNGIEILVGRAIFKLRIGILFWSITQEWLGLLELNFCTIFEFFGQIYYKVHGVYDSEIAHKTYQLKGVYTPGDATWIIVLYTCATRETRKKGCFLRPNAIHTNCD